MDIHSFRSLVDAASPDVAAGDAKELHDRIRAAFTSGRGSVRKLCGDLVTDLINEHVVLGVPLGRYYDVLTHLRDALISSSDDRGDVVGDWAAAVKAASDHVAVSAWPIRAPERLHSRQFAVARAARSLKDAGFKIHLAPGLIRLEEASETAVVSEIERLVKTFGGLNLLRRIFDVLSSAYDASLERYHLVPNVSMEGNGKPQVPWGYLVQLAVKYIQGQRPYIDSEENRARLIALATNYAAILDVQQYVPIFGLFYPEGLLRHIQEIAVYDTMFRLPQLRPSDVERLCAGLLSFWPHDQVTLGGWTLGQALDVTNALFTKTPNLRGPMIIADADMRRHLRHIPGNVVSAVLEQVLSHPAAGANQHFSQPTDAPSPENPECGLDFAFKPLLRLPGRRYLMIDRSVCAVACPEALFAALRQLDKGVDDKVGKQAEAFLETELAAHGVPVLKGDYDVNGEHGECDLVVEDPSKIIFLELKKKSITRRARAGNAPELLLDLAGSLLAAQAQAGWHEVRLRTFGSLDLVANGQVRRLDQASREIERVAVALLDYGGFQDRSFLKQLMETTLGISFSPTDKTLKKPFEKINKALTDIGHQVAALHPGQASVEQPFFHCWFLSLPQILVLLDDVTDPPGFWKALSSVRHIITGTSDFYHDYSYMKDLRSHATPQATPA